jgi:hypothetical protein
VRRKPSTNKEADVEETIGYEDLFSADEWDSLDLADEELTFPEVDPDGAPVDGMHKTRVFPPPGQYEGDENRFDVECDWCGWLTATDTEQEAETIVRLHEALGAVPIREASK